MFTVQQLYLIAEACVTEKEYLEKTERRGIPTAIHVANITAVRSIALEKAQELQKAELTKAKEDEAKRKAE